MKSLHLSLNAKISECAGRLIECRNVGAVWTDNAEAVYRMWIVFYGNRVLKSLNFQYKRTDGV